MGAISPLRYPGGKGKFSGTIIEFIRLNGLVNPVYVEPYAGGAGVALNLLRREYAWNVVVNDLDSRIYAFWWSILNKTDEFISLIRNTPLNVDSWYEQKEVYKTNDSTDTLSLGFSTFYLNRTSRSGVLNAGPIGGADQKGNYLIDARYNVDGLIDRINTIKMYSSRIILRNCDAVEVMDEFSGVSGSFFYCDPPYFDKGSYLYANYYTKEDHSIIRDRLISEESPWILTYDDVPEIRALYEGCGVYNFSLYYSLNNERKRMGKELAITPQKYLVPPNLINI